MPAILSSPFDAAGNRAKLAATIGASADFVTEFSYDNLQRMTGVQQHGVSGGSAVADKRIDLVYNAAGQFSAISRFANIAGTQAVATSDFVYDGATSTTAIANHIAYDAFGRVTAQSNAAVDHLFGYPGREWDSAVDLQYNRARWHDPAIGRWLSEDPIGFAAGDAIFNRYVGNSSTSATDPSGLVDAFLGGKQPFSHLFA